MTGRTKKANSKMTDLYVNMSIIFFNWTKHSYEKTKIGNLDF